MFSTDHVSNGAYLDNVRLTEIKINEKHLLLWFYRVCGFSIYRDWTVHKPIFKWIVIVSQSTGIIHFDALLVKHWKLIEHVKLKRYYFQIQKAFPNLRFPWTVIIFLFWDFDIDLKLSEATKFLSWRCLRFISQVQEFQTHIVESICNQNGSLFEY